MTGDPVVWWLAADDGDGLRAQLEALGPPAAGGGLVEAGSGPARLGIVDPDERKLRLARRMLAEAGGPWRGRSDLWFTPSGGLADAGGRVAFLFPGVEPAFDLVDDHLAGLAQRLGVVAPALADDTVAHRSASIVRLGIFLDGVLRRLGVVPDALAGHSIGEWSASVASGMFTRDDADRLLDGIDPSGVSLPDLDFVALSAGADSVARVVEGIEHVVVSHDNCPGQSVICGPPEAARRALAALRAAGILGYTLDFQSGFHTPFIEPALVEFRHYLEGLSITPPRIPLWSATTTGPYPAGRADIVELHLRHLVEPVRFRPMVERLYHEAGVRVFVQVGVGTLTGFVDDTLGDLAHATVPAITPKRSALAQAYRTLTALWAEGVPVDPRPLASPAPVPRAGSTTPRATEPPATAPPPAAPPMPALTGAGAGATATAASVPLAGATTPRATEPPPVPRPAATAEPALTGAGVAAATEAPVVALAGGGVGVAAPTVAAVRGAVELLGTAARATGDVLEALAGRLAPVPSPFLAAPVPAPVVAQVPGKAWPAGKVVVTRRLSLETMPETVDHSLYHQPPGWPDVSDGFPIVAMTTQIQLLQDVVAEYAGGRDVVEVSDVRNFRWLDLSSPQDVDITITPRSGDVLNVALGPYCRANVRVGSFRPAPRHEARPLANPHPTRVTAQEMFEQRIMFHGPRFQGIETLGPTGDDGILADFVHLDTPGSLLDNLGKIIAYWVIEQRNPGESPLPIGVDRIELFGPPIAPGTGVHCDVRIRDLQPDLVKADGVLVLPDGRVWCRVEGWTSNVFHLDQVMERVYHRIEACYADEPQPGGWAVVIERWPTGAGRDLTSRRYLSRAERERYAGMNLLEQRRWLIDVVAAKEAVRRWLGEAFGIVAYPVEVGLVEEGERRFRAVSPLIPEGHDPRITVSQLNWLAVSVLGDGRWRDVEAREVPVDGDGDAAAVAEEAAAAVRARNPGVEVASVPAAPDMTPSSIEIVVVPPFAVAWTATDPA